MNVGDYYQGILRHSTFFIKVPYPDTVSYVFSNFENGLSAISFEAGSEFMKPLDDLLSDNSRLLSLEAALEDSDIRKMISKDYPSIKHDQIYTPGSLEHAIQATGNFINNAFFVVGSYLLKGVQKTGEYLDSKLDQEEPSKEENTEKLEKKTEEVEEKMYKKWE